MKKLTTVLVLILFIVALSFADDSYVILKNELEPYIKTNNVVSSFNMLTGNVSIEGGFNVTLTTNNNVITISASGGGGGTQVQSDWEETDSTNPAFIVHKPTIPTVPTDVSVFNNDAGYITDSALPHLIPGSNISIATNGVDLTISATASYSSAATHVAQFSVQDEDISETTYNVSLDYSEQWFETTTSTSGTKTLNIPAKTTVSDIGYLTLYLDENYQYNELFDISPDNIFGLPVDKPWLNSTNSLFSVWKIEFETIPNSTNWFYIKNTEYVITDYQPEIQPDIYLQFETGSFPAYAGTSFNAYDTITGSDIAMTCQRLNKGNSADDKKVDTCSLRMAPANGGANGYFYNTTAFASPITKLSFQYAKYGTDTCESFKVYTSTDGSTWSELADLTDTITENLQTYFNDSTIPLNTYFIKFENTSSVSSSTNNRKLNIDEIKIQLAN